MVIIIPQSDHRLRSIMFITQTTQARRAQQKVFAGCWFEPEPAGSQHAQKMSTRKKQHISRDRAHAAHNPICPQADLRQALLLRGSHLGTVASRDAPRGFQRCGDPRTGRSSIRVDRDRPRRCGAETGQFACPWRHVARDWKTPWRNLFLLVAPPIGGRCVRRARLAADRSVPYAGHVRLQAVSPCRAR